MSLVEMLIVVTIIGVLSAIAIVPVTRVTKEASDTSRDRRNAQQLASVCAGGSAAGVKFVVVGDLQATVDNIVAGTTASEGVFAGSEFRVPNLSAQEKTTAMRYLELLNDDCLVYRPDF